jgi:hypothetical protein
MDKEPIDQIAYNKKSFLASLKDRITAEFDWLDLVLLLVIIGTYYLSDSLPFSEVYLYGYLALLLLSRLLSKPRPIQRNKKLWLEVRIIVISLIVAAPFLTTIPFWIFLGIILITYTSVWLTEIFAADKEKDQKNRDRLINH